MINCKSISKDLFTKNLKIFRLNRDLSINKAAHGIGITVSFLAALEKGEKCPHFDTIDKICEFYQIHPYELYL